MFRAWEDFGQRIKVIRLDIPESNDATPDFLAQVRWELEWLLKMQSADGSVYYKLSTKQFGGFVLPEREDIPRYVKHWGSAATADLVALMAQRARNFRPYDSVIADRRLASARKPSAFWKAQPIDHPADSKGLGTGATR